MSNLCDNNVLALLYMQLKKQESLYRPALFMMQTRLERINTVLEENERLKRQKVELEIRLREKEHHDYLQDMASLPNIDDLFNETCEQIADNDDLLSLATSEKNDDMIDNALTVTEEDTEENDPLYLSIIANTENQIDTIMQETHNAKKTDLLLPARDTTRDTTTDTTRDTTTETRTRIQITRNTNAQQTTVDNASQKRSDRSDYTDEQIQFIISKFQELLASYKITKRDAAVLVTEMYNKHFPDKFRTVSAVYQQIHIRLRKNINADSLKH